MTRLSLFYLILLMYWALLLQIYQQLLQIYICWHELIIYIFYIRNKWEKWMTMRTLYLNRASFRCLFKCLNLTSLPLCFTYLKYFKRYQKPVVFKYRVLIAICFSHLFLYIKFSLRVLNNLLFYYILYMLLKEKTINILIKIYFNILIYIHIQMYILIDVNCLK